MAISVKSDDILEGMESQSHEWNAYLNRKTGEVVPVSDENLSVAEEDAPLEDIPDWQQEQIKVATEILWSSDYTQLPDQFEINEYRMMEQFCLSLSDNELSDKMYYSIKGSRAFRRFKDNIYRFGIAEDWYRFREERYKQVAIRWCEHNNIPYTE